MSEIEKMYKLAGIEPDINYICDIEPPCEESLLYGCKEGSRSYDMVKGYPEFTAEKQIEITKFLLKKAVYYDVKDDKYWFYLDECESADYKPFDEAIAHFINNLWQDLTEEEKQQVENILEE